MARTVVITGSASGIGKATADLMRARGDKVIGVDLRDAEVIADLSTEAGCAAMIDKVSSLAGDRIDAVIGNAGVLAPASLCYAVNYHGCVRTMEGLRPLLAKSAAPRAVVTASFAASGPLLAEVIEALENGRTPPDEAVQGMGYMASKQAIARWVRRSAPTASWAGANVMLNAVCPGLIETPMQQESAKQESVINLIKSIPLKRVGQPGEIAHAFAFLASAENTYITGQLLYVDGALEVLSRPLQI